MSAAPHRRFVAGIALVICASASAGVGPRALVRTVTTSALGEAHGVYIHTIDIDRAQQVGVPLWLAGDAPASALHLSSDGRVAATTVSVNRFGSATYQHLATFGTMPVPPRPAAWFEDLGAGAETSLGLVAADEQQWLASYSGTELPGSTAERGTIVMRPLGEDGVLAGQAKRQLLPGTPVAGLTFNNHESAAVLAWDRDSAQWAVHVIHAASRTGLRTTALKGVSGGDGTNPSAALGVTGDEFVLLALIPDSLAEYSERGSTLVAVNSESLAVIGDPIRIRGAPDHPTKAIEAANGNTAWITTRDATSAFGYVTYIELDENGPAIKDDPSYTAADAAPVVAAAGEQGRAAIASGIRLETRSAGEGVIERREFSAPIGAIAWHESELLVAEGGRFHRLNASDLSIESTVQLQTGQIDAIVGIPATAWNPEDADADGLDFRQEFQFNGLVHGSDTDADGLLDGVDPDVRNANPVLIVNPRIQLHARAAGYEERLLRIDSIPHAEGRWSINYDEASAPWLRVNARLGAIPGGPHLRLDPGLLPRTGDTVAIIELRAVDSDDRELAGSPMRIRVQVVQNAATLRRIAWFLGDPENRERMQPVADALSGAPLHFTHDHARASASIDTRNVHVVVMDEAAAAQSLVTRRSITEFVRAGGSLLFIRSPSESALARPTVEWLRPFGVTLSPGDTMKRDATVQPDHVFARWWQSSWTGKNGRAFIVQSPAPAVLATAGDESYSAFASTGHYGLGRVAVFASPSPLFDSGDAHRRFAMAMFSWLARASLADDPGQRDSDGDALPDWLEDTDRDGVHTPGETDWANPDTDGDGIPDGAEDVNLNGVLDAGETSPLRVDTDGDGIWDGADVTPIPPFAAPRIATIFPNAAPAHGGRTIVIQGLNLRASQRVWFGDRLAREVRTVDARAMSVVVPPASPQSRMAAVDIRIEDTATGLEHVAANAFRYSEPARVSLTLHPMPEAAGPDLGVLSLRISSRDKVAIGRVALTLTTSPPGALTWGTLERGVATTMRSRSLIGSTAPDGSLAIAIGASRKTQGMGEFVTIPWAYAGDRTEPVSVQISNARVTADNGYPLHVDAPAAFGLR